MRLKAGDILVRRRTVFPTAVKQGMLYVNLGTASSNEKVTFLSTNVSEKYPSFIHLYVKVL